MSEQHDLYMQHVKATNSLLTKLHSDLSEFKKETKEDLLKIDKKVDGIESGYNNLMLEHTKVKTVQDECRRSNNPGTRSASIANKLTILALVLAIITPLISATVWIVKSTDSQDQKQTAPRSVIDNR